MLVPDIPPPQLRTVHNLTPLTHFQCDKMGPGRVLYDTVVLKGEYPLVADRLALADEPAALTLADSYWDGERAPRSSLREAGDLCVSKPSTDLYVTGTARAPTGRATEAWDVVVAVHDARETLAQLSLRATGPRAYRHRMVRGWSLEAPAATREVPLRYELAYGGATPDPDHVPAAGEAHRWIVERTNPSGVGAWDERTLDRGRTYPGPQWEVAGHPVTEVGVPTPLAGLGPVARFWAARARHAGTYDDAWRDETRRAVAEGGVPDYPRDFDARFFQCAHPSLVARRPLIGDEHVGLVGLVEGNERFVFHLPGHAVRAELLDLAGRWSELRLPLDTVHVDLDRACVSLTWRLTLCQAYRVTGAVFSLSELES